MLTRLRATLQGIDKMQRTYCLGLVMLFVGLTGLVSVFMALTVTGAAVVVESTITSYLAALINSRNVKERP